VTRPVGMPTAPGCAEDTVSQPARGILDIHGNSGRLLRVDSKAFVEGSSIVLCGSWKFA
jgi:hypothetical protein